MIRVLRNYLQHRLNPVHVYCRLRDIGLCKSKARRMTTFYARFYSLTWLG
ncbi:MAG: hypothetical protein ACOZEN_07780 [Thermodesulfobacteriota bacterium]